MSRLTAPVLDYSKQRGHRGDVPRGWRWVAYVLAAVPWTAVASIHLVYGVEWLVNGERPIPPHHGPDYALEAVLYDVSGVSLLAFVAGGVANVFLPVAALRFLPQPTRLVLLLPLASWVAALVTLHVDPVRAMYFWID